MDKQEPENQQLEEELMEPAEDVSAPSDEPVLSDTDASEPAEEPASDTQPADETETDSVEEESVTEAPVAEAPEETPEDVVEQNDEPVSVEVADGETEAAPAEDETESEPDEDDDPSAWFVVHCYSGYENKVRHNLEQRIETMGMKDMIFDVVVPTQEEIEVRDGKRRTVERHIFPGYVLVNMILTEESWYVVRNTPGVTGFVGMGNNPTPLRPEEVAQIVKRMEADAPTVKVTFKVGERVRIIDGPFNDFRGVVSEIDMERTKVRVMVSFFGRETPVELDFLQVEKS
jgi:transcriptional antiterminator NusG